MSVWKSPHYRDAGLQWALRNLHGYHLDNKFVHSLADFNVEDFGDFPVPDGVKSGNFAEQCKGDVKIYQNINHNSKANGNNAIGKRLESIGKCHYGITAVYELGAKIIESSLSPETSSEREINRAFYKRVFDYGLAASYHSKKDSEFRFWAIQDATERNYEEARLWIQDLIRFRGYYRAKSYQRDVNIANANGEAWPEVPNNVKGRFRHYEVYAFPGGTVIKHPILPEAWFVLSNDIERIEKLVRGVLLARVYGNLYAAIGVEEVVVGGKLSHPQGVIGAEGKRTDFRKYAEAPKGQVANQRYVGGERRRRLLVAIENMTKFMVDVFKGVGRGRANEVCRAFDVAYFVFLSMRVVVDDKKAYKEQIDKFHAEKLGEILNLRKYLSILEGLPPKEGMEVALMYKALPQPDYDYFGAAERQKKMYEENQEAADQDGAATGAIFEEILKYHKWLMIHAYIKRHNVAPGEIRDGADSKRWHANYPNITADKIPFQDVDDIDFKGDFHYRTRTTDVLDLVKDKAIIPKNIDRIKDIRDVQATSLANKNYLIDVLTRNTPIDARDLESDVFNSEMNYDVRADDKAEAKKPFQRWFFELGTDPRMALSIYEESITEYAVEVPGFYSAIGETEKIRGLNHITQPLAEILPFKELFISFDIKKFSPYIPVRVHKGLDGQWEEAFGKEHIGNFHEIYTKGKIHYVKGCIHHVFDKVGCDFEGFSGKKLTMYHCAVMGYVMNNVKREGLTQSPGRFAALIDDGLLRVNVNRSKYEDHVAKIVKLVENIYAKAALRISWDKTFVSGQFATFLHAVRFKGRSLTAGLRAALKMTNMSDEIVSSLPADLAMCGSTASGAVQAGAPLVATYGLYVILAVDALKRWSRDDKAFKASEAIRCFLPYQFGGFNFENMVTLAGSLRGPTIDEGLGALKMIGYSYPETRLAINRHLNSDFKPQSDRTAVYNPANIVITSTRLRSDRLVNMLTRHVMLRMDSPVLKVLLGASSNSGVGFVDQLLAVGSSVPVVLRDEIQNSEKGNVARILARKFLTAKSALAVVKPKDLIQVRYQNQNEAEKLISSLKSKV